MLDPSGKVERLTVESLPTQVVNCVSGDRDGTIWMGTPHGLVRLDPESRKATVYTVTDGVAPSEFTDGACFASPSSGDMFFGAGLGLPPSTRPTST